MPLTVSFWVTFVHSGGQPYPQAMEVSTPRFYSSAEARRELSAEKASGESGREEKREEEGEGGREIT